MVFELLDDPPSCPHGFIIGCDICASVHGLTMRFLDDVQAEVHRAREKFPSSEACTVALTEEMGELAKAMLDEPVNRVWAEAVQVAAMALRCAVEGDPTLEAVRQRRKADG